MKSLIDTVAPDAAVFVYAVEGQEDSSSSETFRQTERAAVPADAARRIAGSAGIFPGKRKRDRPVVRQRYLLPSFRRVVFFPCVRAVAEMEEPSLAQEYFFRVSFT